jgi:hypothetical protein
VWGVGHGSADPRGIQPGEAFQILRSGQHLGLKAAHGVGAGGRSVPIPPSRDGPHGRVAGQALGIVNASPVPKEKKNPFNEPSQQVENFGGQFVTASGTANYIVSPSALPDEEYVYYIPKFTPLPEVESQKQHVGRNMELVTNPSENK